MPLSAGTRLGPYQILDPIGAGGMGEVYRAQDTRLDRIVAVKVLPQSVSSDAALRERFEREARAVSSLNHPHICALYDVGTQDAIEYLVMEYLEGETLAARLAKGPLPLDKVFEHGIQIAAALHTAHRQGIIHRDLKPGNIMLTKSGAKLLDFGLAKMDQPKTLPLASMTLTKPLTAAGSILGTFQYMAPEQFEGKEADARSDIFAFGAVLYEMVTGRKAFEGKTQASVMVAILERDPAPLSTVQPVARARPPGRNLSRQRSRRAPPVRPRRAPGAEVDRRDEASARRSRPAEKPLRARVDRRRRAVYRSPRALPPPLPRNSPRTAAPAI